MKKIDFLKAIAYIYILIPLIIFIFGWTKLYITGVPLTLAIVICLARMIKRLRPDSIAFQLRDAWKVIIALILLLAWVYYSGIGGYSWQNTDHLWRNQIFQLLVDYDWPVIKGTASGPRGMSYYIGFWMLPAFIGNKYGIEAGFMAQYIWAIVGLVLVYGFLCRRLNKIVLWPLILLIFFSGMDVLGWLVYNFKGFTELKLGSQFELWLPGYQFSSFTTQLFWVFNQAVYAWLITLLLLIEKNDSIVLIMAAGVLSAPLPMVGLFPIALCIIYKNSKDIAQAKGSGFFKAFFYSMFTYENVVGLICTIVLAMLFGGNGAIQYTGDINNAQLSPKKIVAIIIAGIVGLTAVVLLLRILTKKIRAYRVNHSWRVYTPKIIKNIALVWHRIVYVLSSHKLIVYTVLLVVWLAFLAIHGAVVGTQNEATQNNNVLKYVLFLIIEIGAFIAFTIKDNKDDIIYICALIVLLVCPIVIIGAGTDFCMRACIPAQMVLFLAMIDAIIKAFQDKRKPLIIAILVVLAIGSVTPANEFIRTIQNRETFEEEDKTLARKEQIFESMNFSTDANTNLFYKYLAK
ncbi:MAG: hypothetical protein K6D38_03055 [Pseudobutyrivibrio sp.]|nr:hypothetical protein [Pseudobutyrivibrio sp.]